MGLSCAMDALSDVVQVMLTAQDDITNAIPRINVFVSNAKVWDVHVEIVQRPSGSQAPRNCIPHYTWQAQVMQLESSCSDGTFVYHQC